MKRFVLMLGVGFLLTLSPVRAAESINFDRGWWDNLSETQKSAAVQGLLAGYYAGYADAAGRASSTGKITFDELRRSTPTYNKIIGAYVNAVGDFWTHNPSLKELSVTRFFPCLSDNPRLTCDELAAYYQKNGWPK